MNIYLVDGYNVIHKCPQLRPLTRTDFEASRDVLVDRVARYCSLTGEHAKIIFDGRGRRQEPSLPECGTANVEIIFSPGHQTADTLIERIVYSAKNRRDYVVVSGDRGIRDLVGGLGGLTMIPGSFLTEIQQALDRSSTALRNQTHQHRSSRLEDRLSGESLERLRKAKGELEP
jgi:predicted RNA-binding protein with PIN domain